MANLLGKPPERRQQVSEYNVGMLPKHLIDAAKIEKEKRDYLRERLSGIYSDQLGDSE